MAAIEKLQNNESVTLTGGALDLLDCFQEGFDDFVLELAESYARKRQGEKISSGAIAGPVEIEAQDVRAAGTHLMSILRKQVEEGIASPSMSDVLKGMDDCLSCK